MSFVNATQRRKLRDRWIWGLWDLLQDVIYHHARKTLTEFINKQEIEQSYQCSVSKVFEYVRFENPPINKRLAFKEALNDVSLMQEICLKAKNDLIAEVTSHDDVLSLLRHGSPDVDDVIRDLRENVFSELLNSSK